MNILTRRLNLLFCSLGLLCTTLLAGCGGGDNGRGAILGIPTANVVTVAVTPALASVAIGGTQALTATATYSDGSSRDVTALSAWSSATPAIASVGAATGLATGVASGSSAISASFGGKSGAASLTVTPAVLLSLRVTPALPAVALGGTQQFAATGTYSDGSSRDVTASALWSSATPTVAGIVAASGLATGVSAGTSVISATANGLSASASLTVTPAVLTSLALTPQLPVIAIGAGVNVKATGTYSDGSVRDVTSIATLASSAPAVATVNALGVATGLTAGTTLISASAGGLSASTTLTVQSATLLSIAITPSPATMVVGTTQNFIATGTFSNGSVTTLTSGLTWTSSNPASATVLPTGVASGLAAGSATITATSGSLSGSAALTVTAPLTLLSVTVTPAAPSIAVGATQAFVATAAYSNGSNADISGSVAWTSSLPAVATILPTGMASGLAAGSTTITASINGKTGSANLTVTAASTLLSIAVTPAAPSIAVGGTQSFAAMASYSNGSVVDVSSSAAWTSSLPAIATILPSGSATGLAVGTSTITASFNGQNASASLTVSATPVVAAGVNLRSAANFGVLAGTSITNNAGGTTLVTGDVGASSQTVDPVQTAGFNNYKSGAVLATALSDLQLAITDANSRTCTVNSASGIDLGGQTLTPGVYCYAGSINITGTLFLNGPGVYIFRTASTLNTTANSIVTLLAGATADSVSWVPVGATTLGANSFFKGTMMAQSSAITLGDGANLQNGRVLTGAAATLKNNVISH